MTDEERARVRVFLTGLGLVYVESQGSITGGRSTAPAGDFSVYHDAFVLYPAKLPGYYSAGKAGPGQLGSHIELVPLDEALDFLKRRYENPISLSPTPRG